MDAIWIIPVFVSMDDLMDRVDHRSQVLAVVPDAEIMTIVVVAANYVHNHHQRAGCVMRDLGYLSGRLSVSRFNRHLHAVLATCLIPSLECAPFPYHPFTGIVWRNTQRDTQTHGHGCTAHDTMDKR
jgi:hypothetical protein